MSDLLDTLTAAGSHAALSGRHSHPHAAYGHQGGDATHDHEHSHVGDSKHDHHVVVVKADAALPLGMLSFIGAATVDHHSPLDDHDHPGEDDTATTMVAAAMARLGSTWGVAQEGEGDFRVLAADGGVRWSVTSYVEALEHIAQEMATSTPPPVLADTWRADMAFENVETGDGRFIQTDAIEYRDCPLPLMLQTETAGGHMGAVLAGSILQTGKVGATAVGNGTFDDSDAGKQFLDIINARGKFGVSIDVAEAEGEFECTERDDLGDCVDGRMSFSLVRVMGLTGTPFPAFEDAYIEVAQNGASMAAAADLPCVDCGQAAATVNESPAPVTAAGGPTAPPTAWFDDPAFDERRPEADPRLVRQPGGGYGCPLTVDGERVYGHIALHKSCHTSYADRCVPPPRSSTGYAAFMLRPLLTAEGDILHVGHLTMGAGHASDDPRTPIDAVRAHYDGAPGAVQMAAVRVGEDAFGIWFAGALRPGVTEEQVARFSQLSVSGDWREVWRGKGLDLVACAAGVTVPGFTIAALAAAGQPAVDVLGQTRARFLEGRPVVLVAAGMVRQPQPWERMIAFQQGQIDHLIARLDRTDRVTDQLRPLAASRLLADLNGG